MKQTLTGLPIALAALWPLLTACGPATPQVVVPSVGVAETLATSTAQETAEEEAPGAPSAPKCGKDPEGCYWKAVELAQGSERDRKHATGLLLSACKRGAAEACGDRSKVLAKGSYKRALKLIDKGEWASAIGYLATADQLVPGAQPKYWMAVCFDRQAKSQEAKSHYESFLASANPDKHLDKVEYAKKRIEEIDKGVPMSSSTPPP